MLRPLIAALLLFATVPAAAGAAPYKLLRQDEDWSRLRSRGDLIGVDRVKAIELSDNVWVSFGGQLRTRFEDHDGFAFGAVTPPAQSEDHYFLSRLFVHADVHLGDRLRVFVDLKSSLASDRDLPGGRRSSDVDELDTNNAFVELSFPGRDVRGLARAGRQEMAFGKQRMVSPSNWSNTRRSFDGLFARLFFGDWRLDSFATRPVITDKHDWNDSGGSEFYGVYAANAAGVCTNEFYAFGLHRDMVALADVSGGEERYTLGMRSEGPILNGGVGYEVEAAYQFGDIGASDIEAFMWVSEVNGDFEFDRDNVHWNVGLDYASGDGSPGDGDVGTFDPLFATGHGHLGIVDVVGRRNVANLRASLASEIGDGIGVKLEAHSFRRADRADALYAPSGSVVRAGAPAASKSVGEEIDLVFNRAFGDHVSLELGFGVFLPGDFIDQTGPSETVKFGYLSAQYTM